jgi:hypothetical protein
MVPMTRDVFTNIYVISCASVRGALHLDPDEDIPARLDIFRGDVVPPTPLAFHRKTGWRAHDLLSTGLVSLKLVSDRVIQLFQENAFSGWSTYPVLARGKDGEQLDGYYGLSVTGRCGPIDNSMSEEVWRDSSSPQGNRYQAWLGLYFRENAWDGSDIFSPDRTSFVFVVEKVKNAMEKAKLTNFEFQRLTEFERLML